MEQGRRRRGGLARRVAVATLVVLASQFAVALTMQLLVSFSAREAMVLQIATAIDDMGALDACETRPGPWRHRQGWWTAWPVAADGRLIGTDLPLERVDLPGPGQVKWPTGSREPMMAYGSGEPDCGGLVVVRHASLPVVELMSTELTWLAIGRLVVLLTAAGILVAATAGPLVRRIRTMSARMKAVVDDDFQGEVDDDSPDELGEVADAFDAAARTARERLERLEHRDAVLRRALADLAHDLRTPLATLKLSASSLPSSDQVSSIRAELNFLEGMTSNFESLMGGTEPGATDRVALDDLVERLQHRFAPLAADKGLAFDIAIPDDSPQVEADPIALEQAVGNLIHNALRWASGHVVLVLWTQEAEARIEVRDDGPGVGDDTKKAVQRGVRGPDARGEGFGLGLAIAEAAARRFSGRLELHDGPEGGTVAAVVLPLA